MRGRWQDWVIALALIAIAVFGVYAIWGEDLLPMLRSPERVQRPAEPPPPAPPPGTAAGPF